MPTLRESAVAFARAYKSPAAHPSGPASNTNWNNDCAMFMFRLGRYIGAFSPSVTGPTAYDVYLASDRAGGQASEAPIGAFQWFANTRGNKPGHVGVVTGSKGRFASATTANAGVLLSSTTPNLREMTADQYLAALPHMKYLGWSYDYAGARYNLTAPSETGTPVSTATETSAIYQGMFYGSTAGGVKYPALLSMVLAIRNGEAAQTATIKALEVAVRSLAAGTGADPAAILAAARQGADAAIKAANLPTAAQIEAQLADEFAAVPVNVDRILDDEQAELLARIAALPKASRLELVAALQA